MNLFFCKAKDNGRKIYYITGFEFSWEEDAYLRLESKRRKQMLEDAKRGKEGVVDMAEVSFLRTATKVVALAAGEERPQDPAPKKSRQKRGKVIPFGKP